MKDRGHGGKRYNKQNERLPHNILDFSANINPLGVPLSVQEALHQALKEVTQYPDPAYRELRQAIAQFEDVDEAFVLCGNGAADLIFRAVQALRPKKALLLAPTFSEYEEALTSVDCVIVYHMLQARDGWGVTDTLLEALDDTLDVVILCNPNNPTGQVIPQALLGKVLAKCEAMDTMLIVDECFNDFLDEPEVYTMKSYLARSKQLLILKAFTKMYAIPGVRLGYSLTSNALLNARIETCGQAWGVSTFAQAAGCAAVRETDYVQTTRKLIREERRYLEQALTNQQMQVYPSCANYIFFQSPYEIDLQLCLEEKGILIRSCANYRGLNERFYRIAVKTHTENVQLVAALEMLCKEEV